MGMVVRKRLSSRTIDRHAKAAKLPPREKPWQLIRIAVRDLRKTEAAEAAGERVKISMDVWHTPRAIRDPYNPRSRAVVCGVCFAGVVMRESCQIPDVVDILPIDFDNDTCKKLAALNDFRVGWVVGAYNQLGISLPDEQWTREVHIVPYEENPAKFKRQMLALAAELQKLHNNQPADLLEDLVPLFDDY